MSKELMLEVADELGLSLSVVKDVIINGQSKYTAHTMKSNSFDGVRWPLLGKFTAKVKAAQVLRHLKGLTKMQKEFFLARKENQKYKNHESRR